MSAFVESTLAAALASLDRACEADGAMDREVQRHVLVAYEQIRACQALVQVERRLEETMAAAAASPPAKAPSPLRLVRPPCPYAMPCIDGLPLCSTCKAAS